MPCYSGNNSAPIITEKIYVTRDNPDGQIEIAQLKENVQFLEACLCALIAEIEKREVAHEIIADASRKGLVDIMGWCSAHAKTDESRIAKELHKFSVHEQEIIKRLLGPTKPSR